MKLFPLASPLVLKDDPHAAIQESELAQPLLQDVVLKLGRGEDRGIGLERDLRAALGRGADLLQSAERLARFEFLLVHRPAAADLGLAPDGEEVDRFQADAVKAA